MSPVTVLAHCTFCSEADEKIDVPVEGIVLDAGTVSWICPRCLERRTIPVPARVIAVLHEMGARTPAEIDQFVAAQAAGLDAEILSLHIWGPERP